jgi:threonine aldolase
MDFRSDNASGAHPAIIAALVDANRGTATAYGEDEWTRRLQRRFSDLFERAVSVLPVVTGTAANALALATFTPPWGAIYCHDGAHISVAECGAPELYSGGARLVTVGGAHGKLSAPTVEAAIQREGDVHANQPAAISISQATEVGTVYRADEVAALSEAARRHRMILHVDGARFANALVAAGKAPAELTWKVGVDVLSFGATKNGCLAAEAIVLFEPDADRGAQLGFRRKRGGHLISKSRFLAAQLDAYLTDELWLDNARHANAAARRLAAGLERNLGVAPAEPVETNGVFVVLEPRIATALRAAGFLFHDWPTLGPGGCRLVTSFDTTDAAVDAFVAAATEAAATAG